MSWDYSGNCKYHLMKKNILVIIFFVIWSAISGQETKIIRILNRELKKEVKNQFKSANFVGDTIRIIEPFSIDSHKNLSFAVKLTSPYLEGAQIITQRVPLNSITKLGKDINIILECDTESVTTVYVRTAGGDQVEERTKGNLFFLYLSNEKQNDDLGIKIQKAFEKAGITVDKKYWYD